jgi:hypothetical protein
MIAFAPLFSRARFTAAVSAMSPVSHRTWASSDSAINNFGRRLVFGEIHGGHGTPASVSRVSTQLPMHPPAPVTSTGPLKSFGSIRNCLNTRASSHFHGQGRISRPFGQRSIIELDVFVASIVNIKASADAAIPPPQ